MNRHTRYVLSGVVLLVVSVPAHATVASQEPRSETQGIKETEKFIKEGGDVSHAVGVAKAQIESTLAAYNALVSSPAEKNMKRDYGKLLKEMKTMDEKLAEARTQVDEMEQAAKTYFAGRATTIAAIQDPALKAQAEQRLTGSQKQHVDVIASLRSAATSLDPVRKDLDDQIKFLGSDLNPSAAASLAPNAQKLNDRGRENFTKADAAIAAANAYFNSLRPSK
jgi:DUF2959 family protein